MSVSETSVLIRDEIHGDITFDALVESAINHPSFQRLRFIKQLGLAEYVFPCANHTRFQHSLGAAYLAGNYFDHFTREWMSGPVQEDLKCGETTFFAEKTYRCVRSVVESSSSHRFWRQVVSLAALLHDVGHGPWSHTFENLALKLDFGEALKEISGPVGKFLKDQETLGFMHEELSLIYIYHLFQDLHRAGDLKEPELYFLSIAPLIHKGLLKAPYRKDVEQDLANIFQKHHVEGGVDFHRLLRPIISGPFDVDRMDYIQRDGRNCGAPIGAIEWRRLVRKVIPCLADHKSDGDEPSDVVLLSSIKNQHVLDDFVFSLFQMYTQVYLHPKIVGVEEIIKTLLEEKKTAQSEIRIDFELHKNLSDEKLRELFRKELALPEIDELLLRQPGIPFEVTHFPDGLETQPDLKKHGFQPVTFGNRAMMKDSVGVFLYSRFRPQGKSGKPYVHLAPWLQVSPLVRHFFEVNYSPKFWIRWQKPHTTVAPSHTVPPRAEL